jgi:DNA-binding GntR family transcriptional regulator
VALGKDGVARLNAATRAYATLKASILEGHFPFGSRLKEEELSLELGVSRTPIREALRQLQADGLVRSAPNRGAYVAGWSEQDLIEIYELRAMLEGHAARRATGRITLETGALLERLCEKMEGLDLTDHSEAAARRLTEWNAQFHQGIVDASANRRLKRLLTQVVEFPLVYRTFYWYTDEQLLRSFRSHRELLAACRAGDADWAEAIMRSHIYSAKDLLLGKLRQDVRAGGIRERAVMDFPRADSPD